VAGQMQLNDWGRVAAECWAAILTIVQSFKSIVTKRINILRGVATPPVWQRNYYERVIRDERALNAIPLFTRQNPANMEPRSRQRRHRAAGGSTCRRLCARGKCMVPISSAPELMPLVRSARRVVARTITGAGVSAESGAPEPLLEKWSQAWLPVYNCSQIRRRL